MAKKIFLSDKEYKFLLIHHVITEPFWGRNVF